MFDKTVNFQLGKSIVDLPEITRVREKYGSVPCYAGHVSGSPFIITDKVSIFLMEGLSHSVRVYTSDNIPDNSYFMFSVPHPPFSDKYLLNQVGLFMELTKNRFSVDKLIMMANTYDDVEMAKRHGLIRSFFCNHNCWLDYGIYKITRSLDEKPWDLVINTRPEYNFKRPWLAENIDSLCVIQGSLHRRDDFWDLSKLNPKYMNKTRISNIDVNNLLSRSFVGGIFSSAEGACYSSSEYILAGLPVVSTESTGGRDYWYNNDNSIIVEPDKNAVANAVSVLKKRLLNNEINPEDIRNTHIVESNRLRSVFINEVAKLLAEYNCNLDVSSIFNAYFTDKFIRNSKYGYDKKGIDI